MSKSEKNYLEIARIRVCGLLVEKGGLLLIRHKNLGPSGHTWLPPGGGIEFGESAEGALQREFEEETGLQVEIERFMFVNEYRDEKYHAIELFFKVKRVAGVEKIGLDPEFTEENQILEEIGWFTPEEWNSLAREELHNSLVGVDTLQKLNELKGFLKFRNISVK